jgi:hypothetical protein
VEIGGKVSPEARSLRRKALQQANRDFRSAPIAVLPSGHSAPQGRTAAL